MKTCDVNTEVHEVILVTRDGDVYPFRREDIPRVCYTYLNPETKCHRILCRDTTEVITWYKKIDIHFREPQKIPWDFGSWAEGFKHFKTHSENAHPVKWEAFVRNYVPDVAARWDIVEKAREEFDYGEGKLVEAAERMSKKRNTNFHGDV